MSVDLPHPLGPRMATCSPCAIERVTQSSATRSSRRTETLSSSMRGIKLLFYAGCSRLESRTFWFPRIACKADKPLVIEADAPRRRSEPSTDAGPGGPARTWGSARYDRDTREVIDGLSITGTFHRYWPPCLVVGACRLSAPPRADRSARSRSGARAGRGPARLRLPTRDPHTPGLRAGQRTARRTRSLRPSAEGNFIIGPTHKPSPEMRCRRGVPQGDDRQFTMESADSKYLSRRGTRADPAAAPARPPRRIPQQGAAPPRRAITNHPGALHPQGGRLRSEAIRTRHRGALHRGRRRSGQQPRSSRRSTI